MPVDDCTATLRRRLANLALADLIQCAEAHGWQVARGGKGSHTKMEKAGRRPLTIPNHRNVNVDRSILSHIERSSP